MDSSWSDPPTGGVVSFQPSHPKAARGRAKKIEVIFFMIKRESTGEMAFGDILSAEVLRKSEVMRDFTRASAEVG